LWGMVQPKLVLGENVAQATQFVTSGAAQAGITALSLVLAPELAKLARHIVLPAELHDPLRQRMVLLRAARPAATGFYQFLQSAPSQAVLQQYGFARE
jgi:molybdate transport system substrate-binding protein